jgi:hypothetical protein
MPRVGFLQSKILPLFGFYPWKCPECKTRYLLRMRGEKRKGKTTATARPDPETGAPLNAPMTNKDRQLV